LKKLSSCGKLLLFFGRGKGRKGGREEGRREKGERRREEGRKEKGGYQRLSV
jgi:hypothetical protein